MEFLLQLFAELVINKEEEEAALSQANELESGHNLENNNAEEFFSMMHFH